jgi:hypothetical protein
MARKKRHWLWNLLIVLTIFVCILAFMAHYKNWIKIESDHMRILSGVYYKELRFDEIDSLMMVDKIPQMERVNGFSAWAKEKGIFKDSLRPTITVRVYVDNLRQPKIRLVHNDSVPLFLNFSDSIATQQMYELLSEKLEILNALNTQPN